MRLTFDSAEVGAGCRELPLDAAALDLVPVPVVGPTASNVLDGFGEG